MCTCPPRKSFMYVQAKVDKLANDLVDKIEAMKTLTVTQADFEAMEREVVLKNRELEDMGKKIAIKDYLEVRKHDI